MSDKFNKNDSGKPPLAILFDTARGLSGVAKVMAYGAKKYGRRNWYKVDNKERYISAALRHLMYYTNGEKLDDESGMSHLDHAITSLLFLSELEKKEVNNERRISESNGADRESSKGDAFSQRERRNNRKLCEKE